MEITQPEFRMPHRNDPSAWELTPVVYSQWAEHILPQFGFGDDEVNGYLLGSAIDHFLYDDGNAFGILNFGNDFQLIAVGMQRQILTRLEWETSLGVFPDDIQKELTAIRDQITRQNWCDWNQILEAHRSWRELRNSVEERTQEGGDLSKIYEDYQKLNRILSPHWNEFLVLSGYAT